MTRIFFIVVFLLPSVLADGKADGRRGNKAYAAGEYENALAAYQEGILSLPDDADPRLRFGLTNNFGATQYRLGNPGEALSAFDAAMRGAPDERARATAAYNAGNAAYEGQELERALDYYRDALRRNPSDANAKFNYEFVRRKLNEQQNEEQQRQQGDGESDENEEGDQEQDQQQGEDQNQEGDEQDEQNQDGSQEEQEDGSEQDRNDGTDPDEQDGGDEPPQQPGEQPQSPAELSREEAERILQALENEESELLREVQRMDARPRSVEKDW